MACTVCHAPRMTCSTRFISGVTPNITIATMELQAGVFSTSAERYPDDVSLKSI